MKQGAKKFLKIYLSLCAFYILFLIVFLGFAQPYYALDDAMEPTLKSGQLMFLNRVVPYLRDFRIHDIIMYRYGENSWVSCILALEHDTVCFTENGLLVNDVFIQNVTQDIYALNDPFQVPRGYVFVLANNQNVTKDACLNTGFGLISKDSILGIVWWIG